MSCLADLLEAGIQKMQELKLHHIKEQIYNGEGCCALGAIMLGAEIFPSHLDKTSDAAREIASVCDSIDGYVPVSKMPYTPNLGWLGDELRVSTAIFSVNDNTEMTLPEIAQWLRDNNL